MPPPTSLFEDAVDVPLWLEADRSRRLRERLERDRAIARRGPDSEPRLARVRRWWREVEREPALGPGRRLQLSRRWVAVGVLALGTLGGLGVALAAFAYDGTYPVNVVRVLGLLLVPQVVLLVLTLLLVPGRVPGLGWLQDALAAVNPGAIAAAVVRQVRGRAPATALFDWAEARSSAARRFAKWQMLYWSQLAAVGFNVAALATGIVLVAFTDLAFGWSTTLAVEPATVAQITAAVAWPWHELVPVAVPDLELVQRSQFFRLAGGTAFDPTASRALTGWWSFALLAIGVYGLAPRLVYLVLAGARLRAATRRLLLEDAGVLALLDRMEAPAVETGAGGPSQESIAVDGSEPPRPLPPLRGRAHAVLWNGVVDADAARALARGQLGLEIDAVIEAGGPLLDDAAAAAAVGDGAAAILVFVPAWEPPVLEFGDLLGTLRTAAGAEVSIVVVPGGEDGAAATAVDIENWVRAVRRTGDSGTYVEVPGT